MFFLSKNDQKIDENWNKKNLLSEDRGKIVGVETTKRKKSPEPGGIYSYPELVKYGTPILIELIRKLLEKCLNGDIQDEWKTCYFSSFHKKRTER